MTRRRAIDAAQAVLDKEGITAAFGLPGAALDPCYSAPRDRGSDAHILAGHVVGNSHAGDGEKADRPAPGPGVAGIALERVTTIVMGAAIDSVVEFEKLAPSATDAPTAVVSLLD